MYLQRTLLKNLQKASNKKALLYSADRRKYCKTKLLSINDTTMSFCAENHDDMDLVSEGESVWADIYLSGGVYVLPAILVKKEGLNFHLTQNGEIYLRQMRNVLRVKYEKKLKYRLIVYKGEVFSSYISLGKGVLKDISSEGMAFFAEIDLPIGIIARFEIENLRLENLVGCIIWKEKDNANYVYGVRMILPPDEYCEIKDVCYNLILK
ncbi:MAG: PilZ domain-containing protein [Clostridia bacterium]|nr:PilZ domain-containing protein [Clostridia bacterium]